MSIPSSRVRLLAAVVAAAVAFPPLAAPAAAAKVRLGPYRGVAAWVDIFDDQGWADPEGTAAAIAAAGARTVFLETCNYKCKNHLFRPELMSRWVDAAHANGLKIVAWYLPDFVSLHRDRKRSVAAINFRSATGQRFDSFALDIEARIVNPVERRNARVIELSKRIRKAAGARYPLGAITPPWFYEWGGPFPYAALDRWYDVFVPMIYFGGRSSGAKAARENLVRNVEQIVNGAGDPGARIHAIGGIADELNQKEVRAFAAAARNRGAIGVSLYDHFTSGPEDYPALAAFRR
jgi:hypothetical protein